MFAPHDVLRRFSGAGIVVAAFIFSFGVFLYHNLTHHAPLLPTILGQWIPVILSVVFGGLGYSVLTIAETPRERSLVGVRTGAAYLLGGIAAGGYAFHQNLSPEVVLTTEAVLFQATFVAIVVGIGGIALSLEAIRRDRAKQELERNIEQLEVREQQLERQNEQLESFASIVSHDLRNPLKIAEGHLELVREDHENEHLEQVSQALERMYLLIDDLLELARVGDQVRDIETVDLTAAVEHSWQNVGPRVATLQAETTRSIQADRSRLLQLFENLFRNAIEHAGEDVTVTVGPLEDGFYIEDDGEGIPEESREEVFDMGHTSNPEGTGFGLSIVKEVVEAHDWQIEVTQGNDGGARFEFTGVETE